MKQSFLRDRTKICPKGGLRESMLILQFLHEVGLTTCNCGSAAMLDRKTILQLVEPVSN